MPDGYGFAPEDCPHCGARVWHHFSRIIPETWTEADFIERYEVIEETKTIRERNPPEPLDAQTQAVLDAWVAAEAKAWENAIIYGTGVVAITGILGRSVIQDMMDLSHLSLEVISPEDLTPGYAGGTIDMIIPDEFGVKMSLLELRPEVLCKGVEVFREPRPTPPWREKRRRLNPKKNKRRRR
jgi:hypothetical protein